MIHSLPKFISLTTTFLLMIISFVGCVGTVDDAGLRESNFGEGERVPITYSGIIRANSIAQDKIEIEFEETYNSNTHNYFLHINEDEPIKLSLESLGEGQIGYKKYTLKNLLPNSFYKLRISVSNINGQRSSGENEVVVRTFDNRVADFGGIVDVAPLTGSSHTSVRVSWIPTVMQGTYEAGPFDTTEYEVTYMKTTSALQYLNDAGTADRIVVNVAASASDNPSYVDIKTLEPDTSYYFQVRAKHKLYTDQEKDFDDNGTPITLDRDVNTSWIRYKTTANTGIYTFDKDSVVVKNSPGISGLTSIQVFWKAPEGIFNSYKVFYREYLPSDGTDPYLDDELTPLAMQSYLDSVDTSKFKSIEVDKTFTTLTGLNKYSWYQVKVVPCKTIDCTISPESDPNASIVSNLKAIRVEPVLAPFFGINFVKEPSDASATDEIKLTFDPPVMAQGYANKLDVFCLSYDQNDFVALSKTPVSTTVGNCNGLNYKETIDINSTVSLTIDSVKNIKTSPPEDASYCFAIVPKIEGAGLETKTLDRAKWVVRCIQPDIKTPTIKEFKGFANACSVSNDTVSLDWDIPTGGIYNNFRVFAYKPASSSEAFNFFDMIQKLYSSDPNLIIVDKSNSETSHAFTNLEVGAKYQYGVLAFIDPGTPGDFSDDIYSEFNAGTTECRIPYPKATFNEWTRIFAIGPKVNGLVPKMNNGIDIQDSAYIYEAINREGIPYEVERAGDYVSGFTVTSPGNYALSPGNFEAGAPSTFTDLFDGKPDNGLSASNSGAISLAWKNVDLEFAQTLFETGQDHSTRSGRDFGYRVYRSDDNRENWTDVTDQSGLIHAGDYSYYVRSNSSLTTEKMSFFTDYSVSSLPATTIGSDRARVYWYKIVPVFGGIELEYENENSISSNSTIKVTLPPANMALVHRKMANRNICLEMNKAIDHDNHYRCDYNGVGSRPKSLPWRSGETAYDFGSDMLIDRNEVGCNFTRGSSTSTPQYGNSYFDRGDYNQSQKIRSELATFTGYSTDAADADNQPFRGCTQSVSYATQFGSLLSMIETAPGMNFDPGELGADYDEKQYSRLMYGDCVYSNSLPLYSGKCANQAQVEAIRHSYPGLPSEQAYQSSSFGIADCTAVDNDRPNFFNGNNSTELGLFDESFIQNVTIQAEHLAVIYNRDNTRSYIFRPHGPAGRILNSGSGDFAYIPQTCFVNLAAIGAKPVTGNAEWKSRWVAANVLNKLKSDDGSTNAVNKTVAELHADSNLYSVGDTTEYRVPDSTLHNLERFSDDSTLAHVFSSNSAKLPPLIGFTRMEANRVCNANSVEVGFLGDNGYTKITNSKEKRLLRKSEFVAAAAHPETRIDNIVGDSVSQTIKNIESGHANGSCNTNRMVDGSGFLGFTDRYFTSSKGASQVNFSYLWTGSSTQDGAGSFNSDQCVSRYGLQDMVGNLSEYSSEEMHCDYALDTVYFGVKNVVSQSVVVDGYVDKVNKSGYKRLYPRDGRYYIDDDAVIILTGPNGIDEGGAGDDIVLGDDETIELWTDASPLSGYCSIVDNEGSRVLYDNNFMNTNGDFKTALRFDGSIDSTVVPRTNTFDVSSVEFLRNGDGRFINSGPVNLMPKIADFSHSWALSSAGIASFDANNQAIGKYFNPAVGLPLVCDNTDRDSCGVESSDNLRFTTEFLKDPSVLTYEVDDFPIGNSQILHKSLGTTTETNLSLSSTQSQNDITRLVIKEVVVDSADLTDIDRKTVLDVRNETPATSGLAVDMSRVEFDIQRFSKLIFHNGGDYGSAIGGRYGMNIEAEFFDPENLYNISGDTKFGFRCGVRINE